MKAAKLKVSTKGWDGQGYKGLISRNTEQLMMTRLMIRFLGPWMTPVESLETG